jgi:hypothetical protein
VEIISKSKSSPCIALIIHALAGAGGSSISREKQWAGLGQDVNDSGQIQSYYLLHPNPTAFLRKVVLFN